MASRFELAAWAGLFGLCFGSFANVFIARYPQGESLWWPPSRCPHCGHAIRWWHNVPILGWLWLRGRCRDCNHSISPSYLWVEASFGFLAVAWVSRFGTSAYSLYLGSFCMLLWLVALVDWQTMHIYDVLTLPMGIAGFCGSLFFPQNFDGQRWQSAAAMFGMALTMWAMARLGKLYAKRDALGGGDIKLMVAAAGFIGFSTWSVLLLAVFLGLPIMFFYQRYYGLGWRDAAPFGPALTLACAIAAWDLAGGGILLRTFDPFF